MKETKRQLKRMKESFIGNIITIPVALVVVGALSINLYVNNPNKRGIAFFLIGLVIVATLFMPFYICIMKKRIESMEKEIEEAEKEESIKQTISKTKE